jgi:hypothetical protein
MRAALELPLTGMRRCKSDRIWVLSKTHFEDYVVNIKPDIGTKSLNMYTRPMWKLTKPVLNI